jgi:hypothetical protein
MTIRLRQSTAITISFGRFVDATDGVTAETALTITPALRLLSKAGAVQAATSDGSNATHDAGGIYRCTLTSTDTNTLGTLKLYVTVTGAAPYQEYFEVVPAAVYDADIAGTNVRGSLHYGTAQSGSSLAVALATSASSTDDFYNGQIVVVIGGTGAGQARYINDYTGTSRSCTVDRAWVTNPDNTSVCAVMPVGFLLTSIDAAVDLILDETLSGSLGAYNARPTVRQGLAELVLSARTVTQSGNNLLTKDTDGTTTVRTRALAPDATTPTSRTVTA